MRRDEFKRERAGRNQRRVLKILQAGSCTLRRAASGKSVLVESRTRGTIGVEGELLEHMLRESLIRRDADQLQITAKGAAVLDGKSECVEGGAGRQRVLDTAQVEHEGEWRTVAINLKESPLASLARIRGRDGRTWLNEAEFRAGERLRLDFERGSLQPRMGVDLSRIRDGTSRRSGDSALGELTDAALGARRRVEAALAAVGPELSGVLVDVCCFLKGLEEVERERRWPARSAKLILKTALQALLRHYEPQRHRREGRLVHWGGKGYRPRLDA
ncbi:DUF6456 domain-containing protein [Nitratireductor basaltis]|uniref:DUF6456 domain-containing protein n=1 Tax=Nitratireductor basaltis TaxID=472175 RepID=A0A084UCI5_9HYPH|nr:DUF6456 domain-containing protein [Nitratireductor basaltis]KFB10671.1 hypothetical protein EL18_01709 [Nitratireductor basaltis]